MKWIPKRSPFPFCVKVRNKDISRHKVERQSLRIIICYIEFQFIFPYVRRIRSSRERKSPPILNISCEETKWKYRIFYLLKVLNLLRLFFKLELSWKEMDFIIIFQGCKVLTKFLMNCIKLQDSWISKLSFHMEKTKDFHRDWEFAYYSNLHIIQVETKKNMKSYLYMKWFSINRGQVWVDWKMLKATPIEE